MEKSLNSK